ncbi:hypothetical protein [Moraxella lacunata]|uniref:hypothetical protein n=1 Tax=Moraxella lacunata TaxID=477 RepID=UPI003EE06912
MVCQKPTNRAMTPTTNQAIIHCFDQSLSPNPVMLSKNLNCMGVLSEVISKNLKVILI